MDGGANQNTFLGVQGVVLPPTCVMGGILLTCSTVELKGQGRNRVVLIHTWDPWTPTSGPQRGSIPQAAHESESPQAKEESGHYYKAICRVTYGLTRCS